ncbi:MAG: hypothetical protein M3Q07_03410, partial [Pseudobdellovibrionaceae bacterium]|nr:hypothetical protein [Pseudobdellovibrionaceae bacterium]
MIGIEAAKTSWLRDGVLTIPPDVSVLLQGGTAGSVTEMTIPRIVVGERSRLIFDDSPIRLKVKDIEVHGSLLIGSQTCRVSSDITLEFYNDENETMQQIYGRAGKGIVVMGSGSIDIHGKLYDHTWSRLQQTAAVGATEVTLQNDVNWEPGQKVVVITSSMRDYPFENQNEVMTIASVVNKRTVKFTGSLQFKHYGGQEYQVEVGLLSRKVKLTATPGPNSKFGGHVMIMGQGRITGTELYKMGQQNFLGRYPLHYHLAGDLKAKNSYITDNSIWESNWRCISVHGSNNGTVSKNVAYDVFGHCYYLEDGTEVGNEFSHNLAARIKIMGSTDEASLNVINTPGQGGFTLAENDSFSNPADRAAAGFYISNANNRFIGNAASGGFAGFSFPNMPKPIGPNRDRAVIPKDIPVARSSFDGNTAHTSGYLWHNGACIYLGGILTETREGNGPHKLKYVSGRPDWRNLRNGNDIFTNTKTFLCEAGLAHWGGFAEVHNFEAHDSAKLAVLFGDSFLHNAVFNGETPNKAGQVKPLSQYTRGFQFYDTASRTILKNVTFKNIKKSPNTSAFRSRNTCAFYNMTHSDEFSPEFMTVVSGIQYINVDESQKIRHDTQNTLAARNFNFLDADGSATGTGRPTIVGSGDINFWKIDSRCVKQPDWGLWLCPKDSNRSVASVQLTGINRSGLVTHLWGVGGTETGRTNSYPATFFDRQHISGPSASGWHVALAQIPHEIPVQVKSLEDGSWLVLSLTLPPSKVCWVD